MRYFAGLDVGLEETAICIIDSNGRIVRELKACTEPEVLVGALRALDVRYGRVGLEACPLSSWLFEGLAAARLPVVCLEVRHLRAALAAMTHKRRIATMPAASPRCSGPVGSKRCTSRRRGARSDARC
jgi:hypothetical protein